MISCFKDPTYVLMRVLLRKIQCPSFICFCKPSPHIYTTGSLKLENTPQVSSTTVVSVNDDLIDTHEDIAHVNDHENEVREECKVDEKEEEEEEEEDQGAGIVLKSSLKKEDLGSTEKKKVQWVDLMGKELAEIREFEPSEEEDIGYDGGKSCVCVIL